MNRPIESSYPITPWNQLTYRGDVNVEALASAMLTELRDTLASALDPERYRSVLLIGSYGRGEGGIDLSQILPRPYGDFEILIISKGKTLTLKRLADAALSHFTSKYEAQVHIDVISEARLKRAPCLATWCDMRLGHKVLLGDPDFAVSLSKFSVDKIDPSHVQSSIVHLGTQLLVSDLILLRSELGQSELGQSMRRAVIDHGIQAIIGYGDALLHFLGEYDVRDSEKKKRMLQHTEVSEAFRDLYRSAVEFRFEPNYGLYDNTSLGEWNQGLLETLAPVHLDCERRRLCRPHLGWSDYPGIALAAIVTRESPSAKNIVQRTLNFSRGRFPKAMLPFLGRLGYRAASRRERLWVVFPAVAYDLGGEFGVLARTSLGAAEEDRMLLAKRYLRAFNRYASPKLPLERNELRLSGML
ncbi:MAG: hypothetical protein AAF550_10355 [Myxococcota bacterium]